MPRKSTKTKSNIENGALIDGMPYSLSVITDKGSEIYKISCSEQKEFLANLKYIEYWLNKNFKLKTIVRGIEEIKELTKENIEGLLNDPRDAQLSLFWENKKRD